jgi:hypothetical protein
LCTVLTVYKFINSPRKWDDNVIHGCEISIIDISMLCSVSFEDIHPGFSFYIYKCNQPNVSDVLEET